MRFASLMGVAFFHVGISPAVRYRSSPGFLYDSSVLSIPSSRGRRRVKARKVGWEPNKTSQALSLVRPFTRVNTETDNSRCPQTDATNKVKDKIQYSWIGKTNSHSRKRTVDDSRPGRTDATNKAMKDLGLRSRKSLYSFSISSRERGRQTVSPLCLSGKELLLNLRPFLRFGIMNILYSRPKKGSEVKIDNK
ncbi:hypothetical protein RIF29_48424 [Crotalaria pallida]|uniref:Uncharacterized protein n=1 Tax=Crotalaria pallida TaxID=3830 RepID=A0AAN9HJC9_CROPI